MFKFIFSLLFLFFFVSCQTIHYTNKSSSVPANYTYSKWHHIGILGLMEFSPPVNVKMYCENKEWQAVRTQKNVLQGLIEWAIFVSSRFVDDSLSLLGLIYSPEEVSLACKPPGFGA